MIDLNLYMIHIQNIASDIAMLGMNEIAAATWSKVFKCADVDEFLKDRIKERTDKLCQAILASGVAEAGITELVETVTALANAMVKSAGIAKDTARMHARSVAGLDSTKLDLLVKVAAEHVAAGTEWWRSMLKPPYNKHKSNEHWVLTDIAQEKWEAFAGLLVEFEVVSQDRHGLAKYLKEQYD